MSTEPMSAEPMSAEPKPSTEPMSTKPLGIIKTLNYIILTLTLVILTGCKTQFRAITSTVGSNIQSSDNSNNNNSSDNSNNNNSSDNSNNNIPQDPGCKVGEHKEAGVCVANVKVCAVENGSGTQSWGR